MNFEGRDGRRRALSVVLWVGVGSLLWVAVAEAQERRGRGGPCREEIQKACPDLSPGTREFRECLEAHADDFTPECRERMKGFQGRVDRMHGACESEIETHCAETEAGQGRVVRCLRGHREELSPACQEAIQGRRGGPQRRGEPEAATADGPKEESPEEPTEGGAEEKP